MYYIRMNMKHLMLGNDTNHIYVIFLLKATKVKTATYMKQFHFVFMTQKLLLTFVKF